MTEKQKNFFASVVMLSLLFVGSASISFLLTEIESGKFNHRETTTQMANVTPQKPRTMQWKEQYALCALYQLDCKAVKLDVDPSVEQQIQAYTLAELVEVYPLPEWKITEQENQVTIVHQVEGLCKKHRNMYHLGSNETEQWIAVYYGPSAVGTAAGAFLITDVPVSHLSKEQIRALKNGEYEYHSQDDLIAMLDNMSEL